jgi:MoxR-like ATPase
MTPDWFRQAYSSVRDQISRVVIGQPDLVDEVLIAIFAKGHVLIEGAPGLGKTLLVRALARVLGCQFKRIQFTPDLMPSDVTGGNVFDQRQNAFVFVPGPIFTQLCLADEINRAPAKTQASLLEAMQDRSVTADGESRPLPDPFFVIATQNPIESQGTYPLPEAQLDRFLMKVQVGHPSHAVERDILRSHARGFDPSRLDTAALETVLHDKDVIAMQQYAASIAVDEAVIDYIVQIVGRTRQHRAIALGASPRASIALLGTSRVRAAAQGRHFVVPDDVKSLAAPVLRHRISLHPDAELEGVSPDDCIGGILREAVVPNTAG